MQVKLDLYLLHQIRAAIGFRVYMPVATPQGQLWATASYSGGFVCSRPGGAPHVFLIDQLFLIKDKEMKCARVTPQGYEWIEVSMDPPASESEVYFVPPWQVERFEGFFA